MYLFVPWEGLCSVTGEAMQRRHCKLLPDDQSWFDWFEPHQTFLSLVFAIDATEI